MSEPKIWRPELPDRAGLGSLSSSIQEVTKDLQRVMPGGPAADKDTCERLLKRVDQSRQKMKDLYPDMKERRPVGEKE